ncbi:hypothetical protein D3C83_179270 [compost metagenome]
MHEGDDRATLLTAFIPNLVINLENTIGPFDMKLRKELEKQGILVITSPPFEESNT